MTTFVLTVTFDLVVAIGVGMILVCILFVKRMSEQSDLRAWVDADQVEMGNGIEIPKSTRVFELEGPLFFGVADKLGKGLYIDDCHCLILRMRSVNSVDISALHALEQIFASCHKRGIPMILSHLNAQPEAMLRKAGFLEKIGAENVCPTIRQALDRARVIVNDPLPGGAENAAVPEAQTV